MHKTAWPIALLFIASLAGCSDGNTPPPIDDPMKGYTDPTNPVPPEMDGHDHGDPLPHLFAANATLTGWDDLRRFGWDDETVVGAHAVAISGDLLAVGVNAGETDRGQQGFHLYDIAGGNLTHLSFYEAPLPVSGDRTIAFSDDGRTVFLGYEGGVFRPGVAAIDISDQFHPREVAFWDDPQRFGSHTVSAGVIDGAQYVFSLAMGVNILRFDRGAPGQDAEFVFVGKYLTADQLAFIDALGLIDAESGQPTARAQTFARRSLYGHDMTFYDDPDTHLPLLMVAYAYEGLKILDMSVPSSPVLISRWMPPADTEHKHYTHSVEAERQSNGQLLMVVGSETFEPENQGIASPIWILDATQAVTGVPLQVEPVHLSTWRNPGGTAAGNLGLSVHFFRLEQGLLYLSHYHAGVWAIDLRDVTKQSNPAAFGYIMPIPPNATAAPEDCCIGFDLDGAPMVFDVAVQDGVVYAADIIQGVTATRFERPAA